MLSKSSRVWAPWFGMGCKAQTTAIAQLWRGFATPQTAQNRDDRAARDLFSVALASAPSARLLYDGADAGLVLPGSIGGMKRGIRRAAASVRWPVRPSEIQRATRPSLGRARPHDAFGLAAPAQFAASASASSAAAGTSDRDRWLRSSCFAISALTARLSLRTAPSMAWWALSA